MKWWSWNHEQEQAKDQGQTTMSNLISSKEINPLKNQSLHMSPQVSVNLQFLFVIFVIL
jgi:hypothetical protein